MQLIMSGFAAAPIPTVAPAPRPPKTGGCPEANRLCYYFYLVPLALLEFEDDGVRERMFLYSETFSSLSTFLLCPRAAHPVTISAVACHKAKILPSLCTSVRPSSRHPVRCPIRHLSLSSLCPPLSRLLRPIPPEHSLIAAAVAVEKNGRENIKVLQFPRPPPSPSSSKMREMTNMKLQTLCLLLVITAERRRTQRNPCLGRPIPSSSELLFRRF